MKERYIYNKNNILLWLKKDKGKNMAIEGFIIIFDIGKLSF